MVAVVDEQVLDLRSFDRLGLAYLVVRTIASRLIREARSPIRLGVELGDPCDYLIPEVVGRPRADGPVAQRARVAERHS